MFGVRKDRLRELNLVLSERDKNRDYGAESTFEKVMMKNFSRNDERQEFTEEAQCIPNEIYLKNESIIMLLPLKF